MNHPAHARPRDSAMAQAAIQILIGVTQRFAPALNLSQREGIVPNCVTPIL